MPWVSGMARGRALSAGTTLILGGGLALYQMTSLVLGPIGSRQLHLSLTIPAVEVHDLSDPPTSSANIVLGTRAASPSAASGATRVSGSHRALSRSATSRVKAAPPAAASVTPTAPPTIHPAGHPLPPVVTDPDSQPDGLKLDAGV